MEAPSEKPGFLEELKRRRVIRVGLVYVGVAYVVIEAADLIFPRLQLPEWTVSLVIGLVALGFPLALVLAWAFELTPGGLRPTPPTTEGESTAWISPRAVTIAAVLLLTGAALGWLVRPGADTPSSSAASTGAIAVLPFANLSANADSTRHLSDGFHRELVMQLHRIGLEVRPRASVMRFRGTDRPLAEIAAELGVDYVVEGTVAFSGSGARVSTDLIDVGRERPLWNESYDLTLVAADVFGTQSAIAARVAGELRAELSDEETAELVRRPTNDFEAWASTQRGIGLWQGARDSADYAASIEAFEEAIARDSTYAAPHVGVLLVLENGAVNGYFDPETTLPRARAAGRRALALDPEASLEFGVTAGSLLAALRFWFDWDFEGTRDEVARLQASGEDLGPLFWFLSAIGDHDGAISFVAARAEGNPASPFFRRVLSSRLYDARRYEAAAEAAREAIALSAEPLPRARFLLGLSLIRTSAIEAGLEELERAVEEEQGPISRALLVHGLGLAGRVDEARARFEALRSDVGIDGIPPGVRWLAHLGAGDREGAIDALEAAVDERNFILLLLGQDPDADPLREHPRFTALMDRIGIPESARIGP